MRRARPSFVAGALLLLAGAGLFGIGALAHVRLLSSLSGAPLFWPTPESVAVVIGTAGSDDLSARGHETAIRGAIDAWNSAPGQGARLVEQLDPAQRARTDWESQDLHLVFFDEENATGWFPPGTGAVAITPVFFFENGAMIDADVIFNGRDFHFTTSGETGRFDVQDIATHELGHLLGFDHSGWAGSTMYPYVDPLVLLHRSLSWDELTGLRDAYPTADYATLSGRVRRAAGQSPVAGAHVVARDPGGRTRASTLSDGEGRFTLRGLSGGSYTLYATPLDRPVSSANLGNGWQIETDFQTTGLGAFAVAAGQDLPIGDQLVDADVEFGLGVASDLLPLRAVAGTTAGFVLGGTGLLPGSTLAVSDPTLSVTPSFWGSTSVQLQLTVPSGAPPGHVDLVATGPNGERSTLVAAIEVTPPDPTVDFATPNEGPPEGGTPITIKGSGFRAGARVVLGGEIYVDGQPGGAVVADDTTLTLTTRASLPGSSDLVVIDATGVEGRAVSGFRFVPMPEITSVFPPAGSAAGGTRVVIRGRDFAPGATVRIGGVPQAVTWESASELILQATAPATPQAGAVLELRNPEGELALASYDYVDAPDPRLSAVAPGAASASGGAELTLSGQDFRPGLVVVFGADPATGAGGDGAPETTFVDASTVRAKTPARPTGSTSVLVRDPETGQASVLPAALVFQQDGGGGCSAVPHDRLADPLEPAAGLVGFLLLALALRAFAPRPASRPTA